MSAVNSIGAPPRTGVAGHRAAFAVRKRQVVRRAVASLKLVFLVDCRRDRMVRAIAIIDGREDANGRAMPTDAHIGRPSWIVRICVNALGGRRYATFHQRSDLVVDDTVRGFVKAHSDLVKLADNPKVVAAVQAPIRGKVGVVTGGGSGHEPAFIGYVGRNMLDAVAVGEIFSSPTAKSFHDAMKIADGGRGVVCLYGNYAGDNMNVKMAVKLAAKDGIEVLTVVANDDVCSAPSSEREKRRGVAGEILMWKCGAAKAALGASLKEVQATAQKAIDNCRSSASASGRARCRRSATPISTSSRERWKSASATTANRGCASSR